MVNRRSRKKRIWYASTTIVLLIAFLLFLGLGSWRYGWDAVFDIIVKYGLGMTATALVIFGISYLFRKQLRKFFKKMFG